MAKEAHSAVPSWSGYVYQGKIALYHVLRIIQEKYASDSSFDFSNYSLEVEWQEDFSIKEGEKYLSIHQVKAYQNGTYYTAYNEAIEDIYYKLKKHIAPMGYIHLWHQISYTDTVSNFDELKIHNQYSREKVKKILKSKKTKWLVNSDKLYHNDFYFHQEILNRTQIYSYCNGKDTCDLDEADKLILQKIEEIYKLNIFNIGSLTENQYEYIRFKLYQLLDTHILEIHQQKINKNDTVFFDKILDFFKNNYEEYSEEYKHIKVKNFVLSMISKYCDDEELCSESECKNDCWLYKIEKDLEQLPVKEVYKIVLNATPHYEKFEDLQQEDNIIYGLIKSYHQLDERRKTQEYLYENKKYFLPSSISGKNHNDIAKRILNNRQFQQ